MTSEIRDEIFQLMSNYITGDCDGYSDSPEIQTFMYYLGTHLLFLEFRNTPDDKLTFSAIENALKKEYPAQNFTFDATHKYYNHFLLLKDASRDNVPSIFLKKIETLSETENVITLISQFVLYPIFSKILKPKTVRASDVFRAKKSEAQLLIDVYNMKNTYKGEIIDAVLEFYFNEKPIFK